VGEPSDTDRAMRRFTLTSLPLITSLVLAAPREADACGGTFCDGGGPQVMPVDQRGENILFVREGDTIEAHIQIQYEGDAASFAWLVPMTAVPEVEVGSEPLFRAMLAATVPTFTIDQRTDGRCGPRGGSGGCVQARADQLEGATNDDSAGGGLFEPDVVVKGTAGAFEYAVLDGGTTDGIIQWLADNGYAGDDEAAPILEEYLADDFVFVAFKLRGGAGIDEIHPVVLRYQGTEPCVPIRLTRIAATEDMGIRTFFLGEHRTVPTNYRHVLINPIQIDWTGLAANYEDVVTLAVDGDEASGHAFVTEYAGDSTIVDTSAVEFGGLDGSRFVDMRANDVVAELERQGLIACEIGVSCILLHPLVGSLLEQFFPTPSGSSPEQWWANLGADPVLDTNEWESEVFAALFEERIAAPADHAGDLLRARPHLTRMFTTMSPAEMTEDPMFHENRELGPVSNQFSATIVSDCDGPTHVELEDGRIIRYDENGRAPVFDGMPYALSVEEVPAVGAPMTLIDNAASIDETLDAWNDAQDGCGCAVVRWRIDGLMMIALVALGLRARRRY